MTGTKNSSGYRIVSEDECAVGVVNEMLMMQLKRLQLNISKAEIQNSALITLLSTISAQLMCLEGLTQLLKGELSLAPGPMSNQTAKNITAQLEQRIATTELLLAKSLDVFEVSNQPLVGPCTPTLRKD